MTKKRDTRVYARVCDNKANDFLDSGGAPYNYHFRAFDNTAHFKRFVDRIYNELDMNAMKTTKKDASTSGYKTVVFDETGEVFNVCKGDYRAFDAHVEYYEECKNDGFVHQVDRIYQDTRNQQNN